MLRNSELQALESILRGFFRTALQQQQELYGGTYYLVEVFVEYDRSLDSHHLTAHFEDNRRTRIRLPRAIRPPAWGSGAAYRQFNNFVHALFAQAWEDHLIEQSVRHRHRLLQEAIEAGVDGTRLMALQEMVQHQDRLDQEHFRSQYAGPTAWLEETATATIPNAAYERTRRANATQELHRYHQEQIQREKDQKAAEERGMTLLMENLTEQQKQDYQKHRYFHVKGSHTGRTYRIKHGRQQNIYELNDKGLPCQGWCFLPAGYLVAGDVMLAQKIGLELKEPEVLKVANKFGYFNNPAYNDPTAVLSQNPEEIYRNCLIMGRSFNFWGNSSD